MEANEELEIKYEALRKQCNELKADYLQCSYKMYFKGFLDV
jgi:hypothetical protein